MASEIDGAIVTIVTTVLSLVSELKSLLAGNAQSKITLQDMISVMSGENAKFFATVTFAEIQHSKNHFQNIWLAQIVLKSKITKFLSSLTSPWRINRTLQLDLYALG